MADNLFLDGKQIRNNSIPVVKLKDLSDSTVIVDADTWLRITQPSNVHDALLKLDKAINDLHAGTFGTSGLALGDFVLNGLDTLNQFLQVGISGTDFNINSQLNTHTFNLPYASQSATGKLRNTDYNKFITSYEWGDHSTAGYATLGTNGKVLSSQLPDDLVFLVNGKTGIVILTTDDISEGTNGLYFTESRARQSLQGTNAIIYNEITGIIDLDETLLTLQSSQILDFNTAVLNTTLIGLSGTHAGPIQDGDSIITSLDKLQYQINSISGPSSTAGFTWSYSVGRNALVNVPQDLRKEDRLPTNRSPFIIPLNCNLIMVTSATENITTWDIEILKNGSIFTAISVVSDTKSVTKNISFNFIEGDEVRIRCNNLSNNIERPSVNLYFEKII